MATSYDSISLDHLADHLIYSPHHLPSRCATLSSSCHAILLLHHLSSSSSCAALSSSFSSQLVVGAVPLDAPPSRRLVTLLSCRLVWPAVCRIVSYRPLVAPALSYRCH
jgi:hypothetical protein